MKTKKEIKENRLGKMEINKVYQEDCLQFMKKLPDNYFDLIITDPPYGKMAIPERRTNRFGCSRQKSNIGNWDKSRPPEEYFNEMLRVSKNQIIFGGNYFTDFLYPSNCWIVWDKKGDIAFKNPFADCELVWTSFKTPIKKIKLIQQGFLNESKDKREHPTQKPTELGLWILEKFAKKGDLIFDPFAGSGSFLVACKQKGFDYVGCEINKDYVEIIKRRLAFKTVADFTQSATADCHWSTLPTAKEFNKDYQVSPKSKFKLKRS